MNYVIYIITKSLLYSLSILPFWVLHRISDFLYLLMRFVIRYRKKVIDQNLALCFPEKSERERDLIRNQFYKHLCDLIIESVKGFTISEKEVFKRHKFTNPEVVRKYAEQGHNIIIVGNHYCNWEFFLFSLAQLQKHRLPRILAIYSKLKNPFMDKMIYNSRSRTGTVLVSKKDTFSFIHNYPDQYMLCFAADQGPRNFRKVYWMEFMGLQTAVFFGPEKIAKKYSMPAFYVRIKKVKRSYYEITLEELCTDPANSPHGEISETHMRKLEEDIKERPQYWLWSHKRWKNLTNPELLEE